MSGRGRAAPAGLVASGLLLAAAAAVIAVVAVQFLSMYEPDTVVIRSEVTRQALLSDYHSPLADTMGDTEVYFLEGSEPGGTALLLGGVHPNEPAGMLAAVLALENSTVQAGRLIIIPFGNSSAYTHNTAGHGSPQGFTLETPWGERHFRYGDRLTNPIHQYPDPEVHIHHPSGSLGSGQEARNLNRNFPGRANGTLTEQIAFAIQQIIHEEDVDVMLDMHEARPMNPIVNAVVAHEDAADIAAIAVIDLEFLDDIGMRLEITPQLFQGVSQRELGDHTDVLAVLSETPNIAMDFVHAQINEELVLRGRDEYLLRATSRPGLVYVDYNHEYGMPIEDRVGRHLATFTRLLDAYNDFYPDSPVRLEGIPEYTGLINEGLGPYLLDPAEGGTR